MYRWFVAILVKYSFIIVYIQIIYRDRIALDCDKMGLDVEAQSYKLHSVIL